MTEAPTERPITDTADGNLAQARAWDGEEGAYWAAHAAQFDASIAAYDPAFLEAAAIAPGDHVLDIGCGTGAITRAAARRASAGTATGIDLSEAMLEVARRDAERDRLTNVVFVQADAQVYPFAAASVDVVVSRTGAMFFADPAAAFANLARTLRPAGRLVLLVWQTVDRNPWFIEIATALSGQAPPPPPSSSPGPFALADPHDLHRMLLESGFVRPTVTGLERPMFFGEDAEQAAAFLFGLLGWMAGDDDPVGRRRDLQQVLERHVTTEGVLLGSAAWLVTAIRGGPSSPL